MFKDGSMEALFSTPRYEDIYAPPTRKRTERWGIWASDSNGGIGWCTISRAVLIYPSRDQAQAEIETNVRIAHFKARGIKYEPKLLED